MMDPYQTSERVVVVTGADSKYFWLLEGAIRSLLPSRDRFAFDLVVMDFGLTEAQKATLRDECDVRLVTPRWMIDIPERLKTPRNLSLGVRPVLPTAVPSYDIYLWFDSDGWVQGDDFFERYIGAASEGALAVVREQESVYPLDWSLVRWNLGNHLLSFGPFDGARAYLSPPINAGFFAARGDHPVWDLWRDRYEWAVRRSGKINVDQHALQATIALDRIPTRHLTGASNWICSRARPYYDRARGCFCLPYPPFEKIAILHLAGAGKELEREIRYVGGGTFKTTLTYQNATQAQSLPL